MHRFVVYPDRTRKTLDLHGAHVVGPDGIPLRADIQVRGSEIICTPRTQDPIGLSLLWPVDGFGTIQLQTTRLPVREKPYNLHLELARHQLMRISVKREEWGLYDYAGMEPTAALIDEARDDFIQALQTIEDGAAAARLADRSLAKSLVAGEQMSRFHAGVFLSRRQQAGGFARPFLGVCAAGALCDPGVARSIASVFQFVRIPFVWREIQPTERDRQYDRVETCARACGAAGLAIRGGPLLSFGVHAVPDWMYIWENDFDAIHEAAREHVEQTVRRHAKLITSWVVASGLHADNVFGFTFEQVMELTRMAAAVTRQAAPRSQVLIDLSQPWGEYYARNQQTIPPLLYADMLVQSGINFDGFGLQFLFGLGSDGFHLRDLLQVSALIDRLANLGKPIHVTAVGAPSRTPPAGPGEPAGGGQWRAPWSEEVQAEWLTALCEIALSKPYVESVCFQPLLDAPDAVIPHGGLLREDQTPKPAFDRIAQLRQRLVSGTGV